MGPNDELCHEALQARLDRMDRLTRAVFLLHRIDGLDYPAIAWRLRISVADVERRLARAICRLDRGP
jgi:DNA-directed RNA polymerase specialized sigma24 family protein